MIKLVPYNDFIVPITLKTYDAALALTSYDSGDVGYVAPVAFISTSRTSQATAANPALEPDVAYVGPDGLHSVFLDASVLTYSLLNPIFGSGATPYLIIVVPDGSRHVIELQYADNIDGLTA